MKYVILITMFFGEPLAYLEDDAVKVEARNGVPLVFENTDRCRRFVHENLEELRDFALATFSDKQGAEVKEILCVTKDDGWIS